MAEPFIAEIRMFAGNFAPRGWALCDGQLLPVAQNTALFSLLGTTYGGDGRSTFGLPNLQTRAPMHPGRGPGLTARRLGEHGGTPSVMLEASQIPSHTHAAGVAATLPNTSDPGAALLARSRGGSRSVAYGSATGETPLSTDALLPTGGGQDHNNLQPYLTIMFIIALEGLYPSRS